MGSRNGSSPSTIASRSSPTFMQVPAGLDGDEAAEGEEGGVGRGVGSAHRLLRHSSVLPLEEDTGSGTWLGEDEEGQDAGGAYVLDGDPRWDRGQDRFGRWAGLEEEEEENTLSRYWRPKQDSAQVPRARVRGKAESRVRTERVPIEVLLHAARGSKENVLARKLVLTVRAAQAKGVGLTRLSAPPHPFPALPLCLVVPFPAAPPKVLPAYMVKRGQILTTNSSNLKGGKLRPVDPIFLDANLYGSEWGGDGYAPRSAPLYTPRGRGQGRNSSHFAGDLDMATAPLSAREQRGVVSGDRPVWTAPAAPSSLEWGNVSRPGQACLVEFIAHVLRAGRLPLLRLRSLLPFLRLLLLLRLRFLLLLLRLRFLLLLLLLFLLLLPAEPYNQLIQSATPPYRDARIAAPPPLCISLAIPRARQRPRHQPPIIAPLTN